MSQGKVRTGPGWEAQEFESAETLASGVAERFLNQLRDQKPLEAVGLSGGRITEALFREISTQATAEDDCLRSVKYFWADERCVPLESDDSNYCLAERLLFRPLGVSASRCFPFAGGESPERMAAQGQAMLAKELGTNKDGIPVFDLIFLGMGEDGHIASLFPENIVSDRERSEACYDVVASKPPPNRITLSFPVLAAAKEIWLVISGAGKAAKLEEALRLEGEAPIKHLLTLRKQTRLFTDLSLSGV